MIAAGDNKRLALKLALVVGIMLGAAFLAVPFYRLFCQLTGFGGIAQRADALPATAARARQVTVSFNADVAPDLAWDFQPLQFTLPAQVGAPLQARYRVTNRSDKPLVGMATHNVQPERVAPYFNKVECFCFQELVLQPGESQELPLTFFIDGDLADDKTLADVQAITLSYTFFLAKDQSKAQQPPVAVQANP